MTDELRAIEATGNAARDRDGLFRKRDGRWHFRLKIGGRWRQFSTRTTNYNAAKRFRHDLIEQQIKGRLPSDMARWQVAKALEVWLAEREHTLAPRTAAIYRACIVRLAAALGPITLGEVTAGRIAAYQQARLKTGVSNRTVNMEVGTLRSALIRARLWANISPDVGMLAESATPGVAISPEQEAALLASCAASRSPALLPFVTVAIETGARRGVILGLQWKRVDLANRCLQWGHDKTPAGTGRVVPLSSRAMAALMAWAEQFPRRQPDDYVFPTMAIGGAGKRGPQGSRAEACFVGGVAYDVDPARPLGTIKEAWEAARARAGLRIRIHDLRHLAASRMLDAGVPLPKVAKILGWAPSTMVHMAARYGHFRLDDLRDAVEAISRAEPNRPTAGVN